MRSEEDAIMVGTNTAKYDNPTLNTRFWTGKNAVRVLVDKELSLSKNLHVLDNSQKTICYNSLKDEIIGNNIFVKTPLNTSIEPFILEDLYQRKIQSIIIEGGTILLQSFIDLGLWDEAFILKSEIILEQGIDAPKIKRKEVLRQILGDNLLTKVLPTLKFNT